MDQAKVQQLVDLRTTLIKEFQSRKDWRSNRNAIMREVEFVEVLEKAIKEIDNILSDFVTFS